MLSIDGFEKDSLWIPPSFDLINQQHTKRFVRGDGEYCEEDEDGENNDASDQAEEINEADESKPKVFLKMVDTPPPPPHYHHHTTHTNCAIDNTYNLLCLISNKFSAYSSTLSLCIRGRRGVRKQRLSTESVKPLAACVGVRVAPLVCVCVSCIQLERERERDSH